MTDSPAASIPTRYRPRVGTIGFVFTATIPERAGKSDSGNVGVNFDPVVVGSRRNFSSEFAGPGVEAGRILYRPYIHHQLLGPSQFFLDADGLTVNEDSRST